MNRIIFCSLSFISESQDEIKKSINEFEKLFIVDNKRVLKCFRISNVFYFVTRENIIDIEEIVMNIKGDNSYILVDISHSVITRGFSSIIKDSVLEKSVVELINLFITELQKDSKKIQEKFGQNIDAIISRLPISEVFSIEDDEDDMKNIIEAQKNKKENELTSKNLDNILDKIADHGIDSLNNHEKSFLKKYSDKLA